MLWSVSIPSKPGRVLQAGCQGQGALPDPPFQSRPSREGFCKRDGRQLGVLAGVSIPSKPGRVLQEAVALGVQVIDIVSIPSKPGRVLQGRVYLARHFAGKFQSRPSREGFCKLVASYEADLERLLFQSRPSREGFCKRGEFRAPDPGPGVSIPSKPGRVLQAKLPTLPRPHSLFQSRPSREGFCKAAGPKKCSRGSRLGFNPVQAGKGSASHPTFNGWITAAFQSRPSREGFCKVAVSRPTSTGRSSCFNPVQAGKGSASRNRIPS